MILRLFAGLALLGVALTPLAMTEDIRLPGSPLLGITAQEHELFRLGLEDFTEVESAADGLGPAFNGTSCAACHSVPVIGGTGTITEVRAGYRDEESAFHVLEGGTLYHLFSVPPHTCQPKIPAEANVIAKRAPIPLFGAGLIEAIADETIASAEDPDDRNGDGISGRASRITDVVSGLPRIGRFGWKAQQATLLAFAGDAYRNEMGITNDLFPEEDARGFTAEQLKLCSTTRGIEDVRDRRTRLRGIDNFANFMKFLAPIERERFSGALQLEWRRRSRRTPIERERFSSAVQVGESIFLSIGCANCHTPSLMTSPSGNSVFDRKPVPLYSDLLLHDVGTGDGIEQASAHANEIRTPALWGLRFRRPFLHDGSAATEVEAITRHSGEAATVIKEFQSIPEVSREQLLAFLRSL